KKGQISPLAELLSAAKEWSECGDSRVLVTARPAELNHPAFALQNDPKHRHLTLRGLDADSALTLYNAVLKLPPDPTAPPPSREALLDLFRRVEFHPLSLRLLSQQLKTRRAVDIATRLHEELLADTGDDKDKSLRASLKLSLDKLDPAVREKWLPRLGVFQGGAMEDSLLAVTGLGKVDERPDVARARRALAALESGDFQTATRWLAALQISRDLTEHEEVAAESVAEIRAESDGYAARLRDFLAQHPESAFAAGADETTWPQLKSALQAAALIEVEDLSPVGVGVPFLKFHPTLAPVLWAQLSPPERDALNTAHRRRYYAVSRELYFEDQKHPHQARAKARRELPNLLHAVRGAFEAGDETAVDFADKVGWFLNFFGLKRDAADLNERAVASGGGERQWYLAQSNRGEQLRTSGKAHEAAAVFMAILQRLGDAPTYERCLTLGRLGRCLRSQGRPDLAAQHYRAALDVVDNLEQTDSVKRQRSNLQTDLGDVLTAMGQYAEARAAYEASLVIDEETGDLRGQGATNIQLGTLALTQGDLQEAAQRYGEALTLFQQLNEPAMEAVVWHQLGRVFQEARQWDEAERCYRESAQIKEAQGDLVGAARTWDQLAQVNASAGKTQAAEAWFRKAMEARRQGGDWTGLSITLSNLSALLQNQAARLAEARQLAEESLVIKRTLDPGAAEIWKIYGLLAQIADKQNDAAQAREYRRQSREAYRNFPGSHYQLQRFAPLIEAVVAAAAQPQQRAELEPALAGLEQRGFTNLVAAIRRIWDGERDAEALCEPPGAPLDREDSLIVETILAKLAAP
ncbi:MAG: tetratricopeptide repeat protein, partial [Armatimonadota bacterium]|nr:tetratricopeptide repeat protein [Armatimonadota bacterium]